MTVVNDGNVFEFTILNVHTITTNVFTPVFATSKDHFWQLKLKPQTKKDQTPVELFLWALPNEEESKYEGVWAERNNFSPMLYVKDPKGKYIYKSSLKSPFAKNRHSSGHVVCPKAELPGEIKIGVQFKMIHLIPELQTSPFSKQHVSRDLLKAWDSHVNIPDVSDVKFMVKGEAVNASSVILNRSNYFREMLASNLSELSKSNDAYSFEIDDCDPKTFVAILRYLYTENITFATVPDSPTSPVHVFSMANKYKIPDLRALAFSKIIEQLTPETAAELLFFTAWKWSDLKVAVFKYVVEHFKQVRESPGYHFVLSNTERYPKFSEIMLEITASLPL